MAIDVCMLYALPSVNKPNNIQSYPTLGLLTATTAHTMSRRCLVHWMELTFPSFPQQQAIGILSSVKDGLVDR